MRKIVLLLFVGISIHALGQQPCTPPLVSVHTSPDSICPGGFASLTAVASGGNAPYTYSWSSGATTSSVVVSPPNTATYTVTVKNSCGDSNKARITVAVITPVIFACCSQTIHVNADTTILVAGGNSTNYVWNESPTNGTITCLDPPSCDSVRVITSVTTTYTVTGTDALGCNTQQSLIVTVGPAGVPSISENDFVNVYPNPSATVFNVTLEKKALLNVCDITGRVLFSEMENPGIITFGKELNPGLYFLFIDGKTGGEIRKTLN